MDSLPLASQIGGYLIGRRLAEGGMGSVYEAVRSDTAQTVALKIMSNGYGDEKERERFWREILTLQTLNHPHIIPIYDFGEDNGLLYFIMPLIQGASLDILLTRQHFSPLLAWAILQPLASALDYAHENNVIHRDIKPSNILVASPGETSMSKQHVYLVDFGLSKLVGSQSLTRTGIVVGTPHYIAPEQVLDQPFTPQTDVYALTVVLYQLLTGLLPFTGNSPEEIAFKHVEEPPIPPHQWHTDFPAPLEAVIMQGMANNPADRFASAGDLCSAYAQALQAVGHEISRTDYWSQVPTS